MVKNFMKIKMIEMQPIAKTYCPLGKAYYTNRFTVSFTPTHLIPDRGASRRHLPPVLGYL